MTQPQQAGAQRPHKDTPGEAGLGDQESLLYWAPQDTCIKPLLQDLVT